MCAQVGLVFSIYSFASVAASPLLGRLVQLGYIKRRSLLLVGLLVVRWPIPFFILPFSCPSYLCSFLICVLPLNVGDSGVWESAERRSFSQVVKGRFLKKSLMLVGIC